MEPYPGGLVDAPFEWHAGWEYVVGPPDAVAGRPDAVH